MPPAPSEPARRFRLEAPEQPDEIQRETLRFALRMHAQETTPEAWEAEGLPENEAQALQVYAVESVDEDEEDEVLGGLEGSTRLAWLTIERIATAEEHRRSGVGSALLAHAEAEAKRRGCRHACLEAIEHESTAFFEQAGYRVVGRVDDWDSFGHARLWLAKDLA